MRRAALLAMLLAGCVDRPAPAPALAPAGERVLSIPMRDEDGRPEALAARLCRPPGPQPQPLAIIAHGAPPNPADAPSMVPTSCGSEPARWFMARGYAVLFALRRGFGASTGTSTTSGDCATPDFAAAGLRDAQDIAATLRFGWSLPGIRQYDTVLVGQSTGGWALLAYDSRPHPRVAGIVVMAGGRGSCRRDLLNQAAARFGATSGSSALWIYARNDRLFPPREAEALHAAFTTAGGHAELVETAPFGEDGHRLFYGAGGSDIWGPVVDRYLLR